MSQYRPSIDELLTTVQDFLDDLSSQLAGEARYKAKVASFLLAVCAREIGAGPSHDEADRAAWADLLGTSQGDALQLKQELCAKIRRGDFDELVRPGSRRNADTNARRCAHRPPGSCGRHRMTCSLRD